MFHKNSNQFISMFILRFCLCTENLACEQNQVSHKCFDLITEQSETQKFELKFCFILTRMQCTTLESFSSLLLPFICYYKKIQHFWLFSHLNAKWIAAVLGNIKLRCLFSGKARKETLNSFPLCCFR